jgi:hypothetical protein
MISYTYEIRLPLGKVLTEVVDSLDNENPGFRNNLQLMKAYARERGNGSSVKLGDDNLTTISFLWNDQGEIDTFLAYVDSICDYDEFLEKYKNAVEGFGGTFLRTQQEL